MKQNAWYICNTSQQILITILNFWLSATILIAQMNGHPPITENSNTESASMPNLSLHCRTRWKLYCT